MMEQLVKSYEQLQAQFNLQSFLSQTLPVAMGSRYSTPGTSLQQMSVPYDRFGNLAGWTQQLNQAGAEMCIRDSFWRLTTATPSIRI